MSYHIKHLIIQLIQGLFSLLAAYFCFTLLESSAEGGWQGWKFGGGIAGFLGTWFLFNHFWKGGIASEPKQPPTSGAVNISGDTLKDSIKRSYVDSQELKSDKEFIDEQVYAIENAKYYICLCIHTVHHSSVNWKAEKINKAIQEIAKKGVHVRIICSVGQEQIPGAYELETIDGVRVYHNPELLHSDLRFLKVDNDLVFVGLSEAFNLEVKYCPSREWFKIHSLGLGNILELEVKRLCTAPHVIPVYTLLKNHLGGMEDIRSSVIAKSLFLPQSIIEALLRPPYKFLNDVTIVFLGKAASGKSTLIEKLIKKYHVSSLTLDHFVIPLVNKYGNETVTGEFVSQMFEEVISTYRHGEFQILELATDCSLKTVKTIADISKERGLDLLIVYCRLSVEKAIERNQKRNRPVPQSVLIEQNALESEQSYFETLNGISENILELSTETSVEDCSEEIEGMLNDMHNKANSADARSRAAD